MEEEIRDVGTTETQQTPEAVEPQTESDLRIGDDGELVVPESFWEDLPTEGVKEPEPVVQGPAKYTEEELGEAFVSGDIDQSRIPEALEPYYNVIVAKQQAAYEAQARQQAEREQYERMVQAQQQPQQRNIDWGELAEAGRQLAFQRLGIKPDEYDEFDQRHNIAINIATNEIYSHAMAIEAQQRDAVQRQYVDQVAAQRFNQDLYGLIMEKGKAVQGFTPEAFMAFSQEWMDALPSKTARMYDEAVNTRNMPKVRAIIDEMVGAYRAKAQGHKEVTPPPQVMAAVGPVHDEVRGRVNVGDLSEMSSEEQAAWLVRNKYAS